jgi:hypothetical protein
MESGVPVFFDSKREAGDRIVGFGLQLIGTKGVIDLRMDKDPIGHFCEGNPFHPVKTPRVWTPITSAGIGRAEPIKDCGKEVMGHLTGARDLMSAMDAKRDALCSAKDGRTIIEMISAVFESHRLDGERAGFPLRTRENALGLLSG